ncbi:MAG TPA: PaaI family thioesterase [Acidimicrobiales bacterium]|nr:PaaI family thioesterase [Acidimicrobiales bacterium]
MPDGELGVSDFGISPGGPGTAAAKGAGKPEGAESAATAPEDVRFELADQLRRITSAMVGLPIADTDISAAAAAVKGVADGLERVAGPGRRLRAQPDPAGHPQEFFPTSPVIGFANPVAPPVVVEAVDGELRGTAYFDYQYEGPPTCVHGGVIAMVFDEMLGAANIMAGSPGMTGTLTIRYRRPTPLRTPLRLEARFMERDGRKIRTYGAIFHEQTLTAEAEGIFIELVPQRFLAIVSENSDSPEAVEQVRADARRLGFADS